MKKKLLLILTEALFLQKDVDLVKLDNQFQITFQILINKGYQILVVGDGDQSFEFAKRFSYIFQDENIKNTVEKLNGSQELELIKKNDCIICFQDEVVQLAQTFHKMFVFIDIAAKNDGEKNDIKEKFHRFTIDSLNAGEIVKRVEGLVNSELNIEKGHSIEIKDQRSKFTQNSSDEFEQYKTQVKGTIEQFINNNQLEKAKNLIREYESIVKDDLDICSMKAVIAIIEDRLDDAENILKLGLNIENDNFDLKYNLEYVYKLKKVN